MKLSANMRREVQLEVIRRTYSKQVMAAASVVDRRLEAAFAAVPREYYLGQGPWPIMRWGRGYVLTPSANPIYLYADILVGIIPERCLNNGQPSVHAMLISAAAPRPGEHVVHIGAGVGYYTAILARLVGSRGRITAIEIDPGLAERAAANLRKERNITMIEGDGTRVDFDSADVIYINAGVSRPAEEWLDRLAADGRLILPLAIDNSHERSAALPFDKRGAVFCIAHRAGVYAAHGICSAAFIPCKSARDMPSTVALAAALEKGAWQEVTRLYRHNEVLEKDCWLRGNGWCLAYR